jgi:peptidoglycan-associated lipoprotein
MKKSGLFLAIMIFLAGCSLFKKKIDTTGEIVAGVSSEPLDLSITGSDSGKIQGLRTINFEFDKSTLSLAEKNKLAQNSMWIKNHPQYRIVIEGHTDQLGSNEYNLSLGERRAKFVRESLIKLGIAADRLSVTSFGEEKLLTQDESEQGRAQNRRANFVPIK